MTQLRTAFLLVLATAVAIERGSAQTQIPLRAVTLAVGTDSGVLGSISGLRQLPGGRVLVNDARRQRVLVLDSTLTIFAISADTLAAAARYGARWFGGLIPYMGDSTLLMDVDSKTFIVFDPAGKVVSTMAMPRPDDWWQPRQLAT